MASSAAAAAAGSLQERRRAESNRVEDPLHNRSDDLAPHYSNLADDSALEMKKREAAMLFTAAEGHLNDEQGPEALKSAMEALPLFREVGDKNAVHDTLRIVINTHRMESAFAFEDEPTEAERIANEELAKFNAAGDKRGEAAMKLSLAECICDRRRARTSQLEEAEEKAKEALALFRETEDKKMIATTLLELAHIYARKESPEEVAESAAEAREYFKSIEDKKGDARALHGVAIASILQRKFPDALGKMKEVLAMFRELGIKKFEAIELSMMAQVHLDDDKPLRALPVARQALALFRELEYGKGWEAAALLGVVHSLTAKNQTKQAVQAAKEGIERFKKIGDKRQEVYGYEILADAHLSGEAADEAMDACEQGMAIVKELGDKRLEIDMLHMEMFCYITQKEWSKAMDLMEDVVTLSQELKDEVDEATAVHNLSFFHLMKGENKEAMSKCDDARSLFAKAEDKRGEASSLLIAAGCNAGQDEVEKALGQAQEAMDLYREVKDMKGEGNAAQMLADLYVAKGEAEDAMRMAERNLELMQEYGSKKGEAAAYYQLANVHFDAKMFEQAEKNALEAKKAAAGVDRKQETLAQLLLTQIYIALSEDKAVPEKGPHPYERSLRSATDAVSLSGKTGDRSLQATARYWRASLLGATGRVQDAARSAEEAESFFKKAEDARGQALSLLLRGSCSNAMGNKREAKEFVEAALDMAGTLGDKEMEADAAKLLDTIEGRDRNAPVVQQIQYVQQTGDDMPVAAAAPVSVVAKPKGLDPGYVRKQLMTFVKDVMSTDDELELDSPFMEAGMDSLSSVSLMSMVAKEFQMALSPSLVFDFPTVRALEDHLVEESKG
mmetsp:Transcript_19666/g.52193  ORF Transcript_19666/g.52193 Transcript_19666/m.52193 type:complete len:845 (+) Transcript_19666:67-2601(+)